MTTTATTAALAAGAASTTRASRVRYGILAMLFFFGVLLVVFSPAGPESGTFSAAGFSTSPASISCGRSTSSGRLRRWRRSPRAAVW